jgi:hypothetical protein
MTSCSPRSLTILAHRLRILSSVRRNGGTLVSEIEQRKHRLTEHPCQCNTAPLVPLYGKSGIRCTISVRSNIWVVPEFRPLFKRPKAIIFPIQVEPTECECECVECQDGNCDDCSHDPCDCIGCTCEQHTMIAAPTAEADDYLINILRKRLEMLKRTA